jgi:hypothetical protein
MLTGEEFEDLTITHRRVSEDARRCNASLRPVSVTARSGHRRCEARFLDWIAVTATVRSLFLLLHRAVKAVCDPFFAMQWGTSLGSIQREALSVFTLATFFLQ